MSDFDFQPYRDFILRDDGKRRALYTPTDALLPLQVGMIAQREQGESSPERMVKQLPVLEVVIASLVTSLNHTSLCLRAGAVEALGEIGHRTLACHLIGLLNDSDLDIRKKVVDALGEIGNELAINPLVSAFKNSDIDSSEYFDPEIRRKIVDALGRIGGEAVVNPLLEALNDSDLELRKRVVEALGENGTKSAVLALVTALYDSNLDIRKIAVSALCNYRSDGAAHILPDLLELLHTESSEEAFYAIHSIQANCKFYNYNIFCSSPTQSTIQPISTTFFNGDFVAGNKVQGDKVAGDKYNIQDVGNLNTGNVHIEDSQTGETP
jgi:hypothetical protein